MEQVQLFAGYAFLVGVVLFVAGVLLGTVGTFGPAAEEKKDEAANPVAVIWWLIKNAFEVLFDTSGKYKAPEKLMAGGLMLMGIAALVWLISAGVNAVDGSNGGDGGGS